MHLPIVEFTIIYAIATITCFIVALFKINYRYLCCTAGLIMLAGVIMSAANLHMKSEKLFVLSGCIPFGILMITLGLNKIIVYNKCTKNITAECIGYISGQHKGIEWRFPKFRYRYKGVLYESVGLDSYTTQQFENMFHNKMVSICINPKKPARCVYKLQSTKPRPIATIVVGGFLILFAILICIFYDI